MVNYGELIGHLQSCEGPFGLLTMQATSTTGRLMERFPDRLKRLYSAEHGFFGAIAPGEKTRNSWHPFWNLPIYSLYGEHRKPTKEMLAGISRMVVDLCDIGVRCYTYLATLRNTLEACAENGIAVTVLDREIPMGGVLDGPMLEPSLESFVAPLNVPFCHGMTPGECALWIKREKALDLDLTVVRTIGWKHVCRFPWPNFIPPSPAIRSWDSAALYPMTVFTEAYPALDCDRAGSLAFRVIGAPWLDAKEFMAKLGGKLESCGVEMRPYSYVPGSGRYAGITLNGVLFSVPRPAAYYPVTAGVVVLDALLRDYGVYMAKDARLEWLDKLYGTTEVRERAGRADLGPMFHRWLDAQTAYLAGKVDIYDTIIPQGRIPKHE